MYINHCFIKILWNQCTFNWNTKLLWMDIVSPLREIFSSKNEYTTSCFSVCGMQFTVQCGNFINFPPFEFFFVKLTYIQYELFVKMLIWRNFCKTFLGKNYYTVQFYQNFRENNKIKSPKIDLMKKWFERKNYFVKSILQ